MPKKTAPLFLPRQGSPYRLRRSSQARQDAATEEEALAHFINKKSITSGRNLLGRHGLKLSYSGRVVLEAKLAHRVFGLEQPDVSESEHRLLFPRALPPRPHGERSCDVHKQIANVVLIPTPASLKVRQLNLPASDLA